MTLWIISIDIGETRAYLDVSKRLTEGSITTGPATGIWLDVVYQYEEIER